MAGFDPDEFLASLPSEARPVATPAPAPAAPRPSPIGKVTSYGYASDPWKDSNSLNRIGAWNNRLTDDGLAISPDIETKFREAGIKPGDPVQLTLADGTQVVRRWQDRTAQDKQAAKLGLKPLRGRFDFFNPAGVDERDGQGVVSFAKPGPPPEPDRSTEQLAAELGPLPDDAQITEAMRGPAPALATRQPDLPAEDPVAEARRPVPFSPLPAVIESPRFDPVTSVPAGVSMAAVGEAPRAEFDPDQFLAATETVGPVFNPDEFLAATGPEPSAPNPLQPLSREAFVQQWQAQRATPLSQKAEQIAGGIGSGVESLAKTVGGAVPEMLAAPQRIPATLIEGAGRGTFDFLDLVRRADNSDLLQVARGMQNPAGLLFDPQMSAAFAATTGAMPEEQRIDRDYQKYLDNFSFDAERQQGRGGTGNLVPPVIGQPLPAASEAASLVLDPTVIVPGAAQLGKLANVSRRVGAAVAKPVAETTAKAAGAVSGGVKAIGEQALETAAKAGVSPEAAKGAAMVAGAGSLLTTPGQVAATTLGTAKATEAAAQVAGAVAAETLIDSQLRIAERIARDTSKPAWLRRASATIAKIPEPLTGTLGAAGEGAVQGAAIGGTLAALTERRPEEIGSAIGTGGLGGSAGAALGYNLPAARANRATRAEDADVAWAVIRQEQLGGDAARVANLPRQQRLQIASLQRVFDDTTDIVLLDRPGFADATGGRAAGGVYREQGPEGRPRIFIDLDTPEGPVGALAHEAGHALINTTPQLREAAHLAIDQAYGADRLQAMGMEYARRQIEAEAGRRPPPLPVDWWPGKAGGTPPPLPKVSPIERPAVEARYAELRDAALAAGDPDGFGWIRNEVLSEHFRAELSGKPWNLASLRAGLPPGADVSRLREFSIKIKGGLLSALGVKLDPTGRPIETPSSLFRDNPLLADPSMRRLVSSLLHDRTHWLRGLQRVERADTPAGVPLVPQGRLAVLATSPAVQWRQVAPGAWETDFATRDAAGRVRLKSESAIAAAEKARQANALMIVPGQRLAVDDPRVGHKLVDGKPIIAGATLPPQFDLLPGFPDEVKQAARSLEAARDADGGTFSTWYHQIGTGADGSWRQSVRRGLGNLAATQRELSLVGWEISKVGNVVGKMLDVSAARARAIQLHGEGQLGLWGGDLNSFSGDVRAYLANHAAGRPGETGLGTAKRDFINGFFGVSTKANQRANPVYSGELGRSLIKSFRLDRMNNPHPTGRTGWAIDYPKLRDNLMPSSPSAAGPP